MTLTFANANDDHEALQGFADAVKAASGGTLTIKFVDQVRRDHPTYESEIIDDVVAGTYDLAWVAPRPWHSKGVRSFDALIAPFLIDSYDLEGAVLQSGMQDEMLAGLATTGVVGLGILPGPLRRVAMADGGLRVPGDLRGKKLAIGDSEIARMTFEALGASTRPLGPGGEVDADDGVEQQLSSITGNRYYRTHPHVTADLAFWPRPLIIFANEARFNGLSDAQKAALRNATRPLVAAGLALARAEDGPAINILCDSGSDVVLAGVGASDAFRAATQSVYDELANDATTKRLIDQIGALKGQTAVTSTASSCQAASASAAGSASPRPAGGFPDGTYEARASCDELEAYRAAHPDLPQEKRGSCPVLLQFRLKDGDWMENYGQHWTFSFFGDHVHLGNFTMRWAFDGTHLSFSEMEGGAPDDAAVWTMKPYTKVRDDTISAIGFPDGLYEAKVSAEEMKAFWESHGTPVSARKPCPCTQTFSLHGTKWIGRDGSESLVSYFGDKLTLTDARGSVTLRWRNDPQIEEVTFTDVETGDPVSDADLATYFVVKTFNRIGD
ncbi:MAG: hypothetical protein H0V73_08050 [Chloroflexi bacterium]|nr:hypothetical protein [Chloroflexota bacterium]